MNMEEIRIFSLGETALTVEFGTAISEHLNQKAIALAEHFRLNPFRGLIESVPAYASATLFYDPILVRSEFGEFTSSFDAVSSLVANALEILDPNNGGNSRMVEIPVRFDTDGEFDLAFVAMSNGLSMVEAIGIFTSVIYRVYMLGFLPGFSYMGTVDERIATLRKKTPRTHVPAGSVGIAGRQTGIYSLVSPGGWQIIGQTAVAMFSPNADSPCYLRPGDNVKFIAIK
ncbi:MAG: 5-oxoprolinase subunit PxpB [Pyrinomonadaceae bacterium]|nr:5-oxoprolinase subunit PxpB [Pyrinomonadaceae bacterium]